MNITKAIYDKLSADATLSALIATYGGGSPAIFTSWPVPADANTPYVISAGEIDVNSFDELAPNSGDSPPLHFGLDVQRDIFCYANNTGSSLAIEVIARRIRSLLHRQSLTIPDGSHVMTQCVAGPVHAPTDNSLVGRMSTFRIVAMEA